MYQTGRADFTLPVGSTFDPDIQMFTDKAQTVPLDLTGYTVSLVIVNLATLTVGSGLTVTALSGLIAVVYQVPSGTALESFHWYLKLTSPTGSVGFPVAGSFTVVAP